MTDRQSLYTGTRAGRRAKAFLSLAFALILSLSGSAFAQGGAQITGRVTDSAGASIVGAEVRLRSRSGLMILARSDESGVYAFNGLGPGDYFLEAKARGFAARTSDELRVVRGQVLSHDISLAVEAVNENVVVVAAGTPQRADEVSKAVTLVEDRDVEARREETLPEALRGVPGLRVQQQGTYGALTTLRLRGGRNYDTAILLDGLRVRDASDINGSAVSFIPDLLPVDIERVEILRGSGSSIYGTNAIGGVINLAPRAGAGSPRFEAGFEGGALGLFRERLQGSGGIGKRAGYSFGLTRLDVRRGVDDEDEYGNTAGSGRVQFSLTPNITLAANFYGTISNARRNESPVALAAAFTGAERFPQAIEGVTFHPDFNDPDLGRRVRVLVASVRFTQSLSDRLSYTVAYQRVSTRRRFYDGPQVDPRFAVFTPFGDFPYYFTNNGATDTLDARANLRLGRTHLITAGFELERESLYQQSTFTTDATTDRQRTAAIFGQDQIFLLDGRLQLSLAARGQFYRISAADRPGFLGSIEARSSVTGDGSIAYFITSTSTKLRAHIGNGFRAPSLFERFGEGTISGVFTRFGDPTVRAEQSVSVDGGFDQRLARDRLLFGATYFYTRLQRVIDFASTDPLGARLFGGYFNRPGGIARGVETYVEAAPLSNTKLRASYTYTNSDRFTPAVGLETEFVIPAHLFSINVNHRYRAFLINFDLNHTGSYIGPVFESDFPFRQANLRFNGYTKADLFGAYERALSERVTFVVFGGADNLFDVEYFENGFRAPGIVGRGGVNFRF
ncbi:MAG TPA: TonB-dependent receptor [Pyrinomonadaceae bacterium]|nr:TonB-dependent receptor [Pyrinomonadaceae bacterium]